MPRNEIAGATYHVMARGVNRQTIFVDHTDYEVYTALLAAVVVRQGWHLLSYCLMPNHVHLLIETPETNLGKGMHRIQGLYATHFNKRHGRDGHLYRNRYKSPVVQTDGALVRLAGYIPVNPVRAGLTERARDWPWGSHALLNGPDFGPPWLAHRRLVERLEAATGLRCYPELVATWERGAIDDRRRKGTVPFSLARQ
jgi:REP element-mobilizing transposase RayT